MSNFVIMSPKDAHKTIKLITTAGKKLDERIHAVGVAGLNQYAEHGNTDVLTALVKAMPKSSRGNALKYWITEHANVKWNAKGGPDKDGIYQKRSKDEEREVDLDHAIEHPFYEKKDAEPAEFKAESRFKSLLSAFRKAVQEGKISKEEALEAEKEFHKQFQAEVLA